jgi:ribonuclease P protein component
MMTEKPKATLKKEERLKTNRDFERVLSDGMTAADRNILVFVLPNNLPYNRIGPAVSKKWGGAVERNRLKRLFREGFRLAKQDMQVGLDIVVVPRKTWREMKLAHVIESLKRLAPKAAQRFNEEPAD